MPRPTHPDTRVCYADDIKVWASGQKIPELESMINSYLREQLTFDLCTEVNSYTLHPGHTPVADASKYYS